MVDEAEKPKQPVILTPFAVTPKQGLSIKQMMEGIGIIAVACAIVVALGALAFVGGVVFLVLAVVCAGLFFTKIRSSRQETLLLSLAIASERSLPLSAAALAFAEQYGNGFRERVQYFAVLLDEGLPLPRAMERVRGLVTAESRILAAAGWESGQLGPSLRQATAMKQLRQDSWGPIISRISYLTVLMIWMQVIFSFIMYFIIPKFEAIFNDFGVPLPEITRFTIQTSHFLVEYPVITSFVCLIEAGILMMVPLTFLNSFEFDIPFIDSLFRRKHVGLILRSLALAVNGGQPIEGGLSLLARSYPSSWVQGRLSLVLDSVSRGEDWIAALHQYGLLTKSEAQTLEAASRVGNLGWVLRELADGNDRRIGYHLQIWAQLLFQVAVVAVGLVVLVVCVAYFAPLVTLISRLS